MCGGDGGGGAGGPGENDTGLGGIGPADTGISGSTSSASMSGGAGTDDLSDAVASISAPHDAVNAAVSTAPDAPSVMDIAIGAVRGGMTGMALGPMGAALGAVAGGVAAANGINSISGLADAVGIDLGGISKGEPSPDTEGQAGAAGANASNELAPSFVGATLADNLQTASKVLGMDKSGSSVVSAVKDAVDQRSAELTAEQERERLAALEEDAKRKAAEKLQSERFSFGELNLTGPFGLSNTPASIFRPTATARSKVQLGA